MENTLESIAEGSGGNTGCVAEHAEGLGASRESAALKTVSRLHRKQNGKFQLRHYYELNCTACGGLFLARADHQRKRPCQFCSKKCENKMPDVFWRKVNKQTKNGCWEWTGCLNEHGYGAFCKKHTGELLAHRASWKIHNGELPKELHVCHKCDVPLCVNPNHLFLGTNADNVADKIAKGRSSYDGFKPGEDHPQSILTSEQINSIRLDGRNAAEIAKIYGVSRSHIDGIKSGKTWKSLPPPTFYSPGTPKPAAIDRQPSQS